MKKRENINAEKVGVVETAAEFFKKRAGRTGDRLKEFLRNAPNALRNLKIK